MRPETTTVERVIGRLAARSHGVVTRAQLLRAGITVDEIKQRLRTGALLREHRGVYRVGHRAPSVEARYLAAVMASGAGAPRPISAGSSRVRPLLLKSRRP
jgi:Transcriptional regulator, AbiEi antitoxin